MTTLDDRVRWEEGIDLTRPTALLGRDAFLAELTRRLGRPVPLPGDVPLDMLGLDALERYLVLRVLVDAGVPIDETLAAALFTLDDAYEQYALAMVGTP
jgi:hypothetical protein